MLHGWMDVAASFQFVVDALRRAIATCSRSTGAASAPATRRAADTYFFPEYLGDLELVLDALFGRARAPIDLLGHSMGGNVAMLYAGMRPEKRAPPRQPRGLRHAAIEARARAGADGEVARRAEDADAAAPVRRRRRGRRSPDEDQPAAARRPRRLARGQWSRPAGQTATSRAPSSPTPNHKRMSPLIAQVDDWLEFWKRITAPLLWIEGDRSDVCVWWGDRYTKAEFHERLNVVADAQRHVVGPAGHMLHHDRPEDIARLLEAFLSESRPPRSASLPTLRDSPWTSNTSMPSATAWPT